jgi:hypothetical protein
MLIQLSVTDAEFPAFKNILEHLKTGMIQSVSVLDPAEASFVVSSVDAVRERVGKAEERGAYLDHDTFWDNLQVDDK